MASWTYDMSDDIDDANDEVQRQLDATLSNVIQKCLIMKQVNVYGVKTKVKDNRRWCSIECRDEHTKYANKL